MLIGIHRLEGGKKEGKKLLEDHDSKGKNTIKEKVDQLRHQDYGDFIVLDKDRYDYQFFESIEGGMLSKDRKNLYFVGIIDTLTHFGAKK